MARTIAAAEERRRADRGPGYDGPSDDSSVLARISALSSAAGMQAYPPERGADTMMLGGQVVVLDVGLVPEPTVRASYAGSGEDRHSPAMDAFFSHLVRGVVKGADNNDGRRLREALGYLMRLDRLATQEGNAGARWFGEVDALSKELVKFTQEEAALLAQYVTPFVRFFDVHISLYLLFLLGSPSVDGRWNGSPVMLVRTNVLMPSQQDTGTAVSPP